MKRLIVFLVTAALIAGNGAVAFGDEVRNPALSQKKIMVYIKPDVSVELNGVKLCFRNASGQAVYPIIYNGCTYLPVRASSALMREPIEWDKASKTVFIGKTISNPNKSTAPISTEAAIAASEAAITTLPKPTMASAYLKPDILVMYDFEIQTFQDVNGSAVYPIIYNGSTYLPVRSISGLMGQPIKWDGKTQTISIGNGQNEPTYAVVEKEEEEEEEVKAPAATAPAISAATAKLKNLFERVEVLYYEATGKATVINEKVTREEKELLAVSITENYQRAQAMSLTVKEVDASAFTEQEKAALDKLTAYAESTEYYILILENIAYLAAQENDYSMLAETFLYFAMDSQTKMGEARTAIQALEQ